ncbi:hypothetical protein [Streptomyces sp. 3214.6]|uniref:hypothetical protein n=1 Tax=Streptomyces sp. 3214.6 TaxID=1882757 RepID=UPI0009A78695|nr:hypothetical protein [Streptomyces sp. 3214.6]
MNDRRTPAPEPTPVHRARLGARARRQGHARVGDALLPSVNHSGDSDPTGSIRGDMPGARHGDVVHGFPG